jgi:ABC-type sugar transport system ATPase subunit
VETSDIVLEARGLTKYFGGTRACSDVDLTLRNGELLAIVGDNGAGKSTLIKLLTGVYAPDRGEILLDGRPVTFDDTRSAMDQGIRAVYQNLGLVDQLDAAGNLFLGSEVYKSVLGIPVLDNQGMRERAAQILRDSVGVVLADITQPVFNLSGGQRQAVAIARTLLNPGLKVLVLDEPVAALGPEETKNTLNLVKGLKGQDMAIVLIAHNLEHVFTVADRVLVMQGGRNVGIRTVAESSRHEVLGLIVGLDPVDA